MIRIIVPLLTLAALCGCGITGPTGPRKLTVNGKQYYVPRCHPLVQYSGYAVTVKGVNVPIGAKTGGVGEISIEQKQLQTAAAVVQILDNHRIATCENLPSFTYNEVEFGHALQQMNNDDTALSQFAIAAQDPQALRDWIARYQPRASVIETRTVESTQSKATSTSAVTKAVKKDKQTALLTTASHKVKTAAPTKELFSERTIQKAKAKGIPVTPTSSPTPAPQ